MSEVLRIFLIDFAVNVFESIAGFSLILSLFRFSFNKNNFINTIIASVVLALTSYLLRFPLELGTITSLFMLAWIIILLWRLFRIHVFYSALMAVTGYMTYITIQQIMILFTMILYDFEEIVSNFYFGKTLQIVSSVISLLIYYGLSRKRLGFSFVPDQYALKVEFNGLNRKLLIVTLLSAIMICTFSVIAQNMFALLILSATFMGILIYLNYVNERAKNV